MNGSAKGRPPAHGRGWAVTAFGLGVLVSVGANVAHSWYPSNAVLQRAGVTAAEWTPELGAMIMSAFYPVALLLTVEILSRVQWPNSIGWAAMRFVGSGAVALVAAIVSYGHMAGLLRAYGEDELTAGIGPLAVDGMMLVAGFALLAIGRTSSLAEVPAVSTPAPVPAEVRTSVPAPDPAPAEVPAVPDRDEVPLPVPAEDPAPVPAPEPVPVAEESAVSVLNGAPAPYLAEARTLFAQDVAAGKVPTIAQLKERLRVGQPKASLAQRYLSSLAQN